MNLHLLITTLLAALMLDLNQTTLVTPPAESPVLLEATNIIHGVGHYVGKTLLVRIRQDGTFEWEKDLDAYKREKHKAKLSAEDMATIRQRLNLIDQSPFAERMGPYCTYIDSSVELKIHGKAMNRARTLPS